MRHYLVVILLVAIFALMMVIGNVTKTCAGESKYWQEFVQFKNGSGTVGLPDYSYAGYAMGYSDIPAATGEIFDVTSYGAKPDDDECDREGVIATIAAAKAAGGGIVFFPKGRYLLAEQEDILESIRIDSANIILRGAGSGPDGTEIYMRNHLITKTPNKMYAVAKLFYFCPDNFKAPELAKISANAERESFYIEVDKTDNLKPGEFIQLEMRNPAANSLYLDNLPTWENWTDTNNNGVRIAGERHCIDRIVDNKVYFKEPIHCEIIAEHGWSVRRNVMLPGWGVEDIVFRGEQPEKFVHHQDYILDSGWSILSFHRGINPYVRRCRFINVSNGVSMSSSYGGTIINCAIEGNQGHSSFSFTYFNFGGLGAFCLDNVKGGSFHGWGANHGSVGTVVYKCKNSERGFDWHASWPYATLFDSCTGGLVGNGGGYHVLPNHMKYMTLWNFIQTDSSVRADYDFWQPRKAKENYSGVKIVKPYIIGYQGAWTFLRESCADIESWGEAVTPDSLYEAQYKLRFDALPPWYEEAKAQYEFYEKNGYFSVRKLVQ